ncbi:hypothetical protein AURDEDRAFT_184166 [Auricularia subglabra TFB-10046 SS5]|nr:hypothetical protein AURDEDRAFT_184166 [Auricularia subglabra TFB-10046 SS5]
MQEEGKRRRGPGPVSCAECRRLKLKCDRKLPCSSCFKRGCAAICPNGTLAAGPGNRFVLADTQHLHDKIEAMSKRISDLEDALSALQAQFSPQKHPLLADELLKIKAPPPTENVVVSDVLEVVSENFGTLAVGERGFFFGRHANADYMILQEHSAAEAPASACTIPLELLRLACEYATPRLRDARDEMALRLARCLPPVNEARTLVDLYYRDATWLFMPISGEEFEETIFARVYSGAVPCVGDITPHELALLFMIMAHACIIDLNRPPYNEDAANYYELARAALSLDPAIDHPTIHAVQSVLLMSMFLQMWEHVGCTTTSYNLIGLMAQMCQSLGLHRDDTPWNLPRAEQNRRRRIFWNVASYDVWSSFACGRPPSLSPAHVDALGPDDQEKIIASDGQAHGSFRHWIYGFIQQVVFKVMDQAFGATLPTYATVLRLDRLVREHPVGEHLRTVNVGEAQEGIPMSLLLQRNIIFGLTQRLMLFLHRSFFAHALTEHADDPLKSKYAQSVLAAYRAAFYIAAGARALHGQTPLAARCWVFWSPIFSASLILGSIVVKAPASGLAPPAWVELNRVCELLEDVAKMSRRVARIMPKMRNLRQRAHESFTAFSAASGGVPRPVISEIEDMELRFLYGRSRLVDSPSKNSPTSSAETPSSSSSSPAAAETTAYPAPPPSTQWSAGPYAHPSTSQLTELQNPAPPDFTAAPVDDLFASFYTSLANTTQQPDPSRPSQPQQPDFTWEMDVLGATSAPPMGFGYPVALPDSYSMQQRLQSSLPAWTYDLDQIPMMSTQHGSVPATNLDVPWQRFMSGMGVDEPQHQQQDGASTSSLGYGSNV